MPGDPYAAGRRAVQGADDVQQRGLAGARRADDGEEFARGDGQVDPAQGRDPARVLLVTPVSSTTGPGCVMAVT
ncbi:hypothetical protein WKI68_26100 [Streptomyces sp. MS1.HAVA.3]|uniref:Uncharacterized protein n=1 Tax=Streptomyces caledonius TaxID=3134107 RepID=A0ABU8U7M6_9ACTN